MGYTITIDITITPFYNQIQRENNEYSTMTYDLFFKLLASQGTTRAAIFTYLFHQKRKVEVYGR